VRTGTAVHRFGPFELDPDRRRLFRGREPIFQTDRQIDALNCPGFQGRKRRSLLLSRNARDFPYGNIE
jgi:hypothetical protein